jgi:hypothetical protein
VKRCPYCLAPHERPSPAVYCCEEHSRAAANVAARSEGRYRRAQQRRAREAGQAELEAQRWRDVAMGRNADERLGEIFPPKRKRRKK